jgi:hypothetical protein
VLPRFWGVQCDQKIQDDNIQEEIPNYCCETHIVYIDNYVLTTMSVHRLYLQDPI